MKIISWNVNGVRAAEKKGFLQWIQKISPDVLCIQETKAHTTQLSPGLINPPGYFSHWVSGERKGYSGVATFSKEKPIRTEAGFGIKRFDDEGRVSLTEFSKFILLNIYFPNGKKDGVRLKYKMDFYEEMLKVSAKVRKQGKPVVVCGDYNTAHKPIDLARPKENEDVSGFLPQERDWIDRWVAHGYVDTLRLFRSEPQLYTWWDMKSGARARNVGWRIDYHFITEDGRKYLKDAWIMPEVHGSDHCPVGIELKF